MERGNCHSPLLETEPDSHSEQQNIKEGVRGAAVSLMRFQVCEKNSPKTLQAASSATERVS